MSFFSFIVNTLLYQTLNINGNETSLVKFRTKSLIMCKIYIDIDISLLTFIHLDRLTHGT